MIPDDATTNRGQPAPGDDAPGPLDWARRGNRLEHFLATFEVRRRRQRRRRQAAVIAGLMVALVAGFGWRLATDPGLESQVAGASTIVAEPDRHTLPDGTVMELQQGSSFTADYSARARRVILRQGVAHFDVVKKEIPFVVVAGGLEVRAVGTAFSVELGGEAIEVLVTEGRVALGRASETPVSAGNATLESASPPPQFAAATLGYADAGSRVRLVRAAEELQPTVTSVTAEELAERLAWRVPRLEFNGTQLSEVVTTINRYSRVQLQLGDAQAGLVELSGVLRADNVDPLLTMLEGHYGLTVTRDGDRVTLTLAKSGSR